MRHSSCSHNSSYPGTELLYNSLKRTIRYLWEYIQGRLNFPHEDSRPYRFRFIFSHRLVICIYIIECLFVLYACIPTLFVRSLWNFGKLLSNTLPRWFLAYYIIYVNTSKTIARETNVTNRPI